jgi:hypothetical protein
MQRCKTCEATIRKDEKQCLVCGAAQVEPPKSDFSTRGRVLIKWFFLFSAALTLISLLTPWGGSFITWLCVTIVLFLVRSSWNEMLVDREDRSK